MVWCSKVFQFTSSMYLFFVFYAYLELVGDVAGHGGDHGFGLGEGASN